MKSKFEKNQKTDSGEKGVVNKEKSKGVAELQYRGLLDEYREKFDEIKKVQRRLLAGETQLGATLSILDADRHKLHLRLIEAAKKIGKDKEEVLVDIIRRERTLEEYGLPEFSILTSDDIVDTGDWHNRFVFNVDLKTRLPNAESLSEEKINERVPFRASGQEEKLPNLGEEQEKPDYTDEPPTDTEVMLVFDIVPIEYDDKNWREDSVIRLRRAEALVKDMGGRIFDSEDSSYHEAYAHIVGVILPKKDLEKITAVIRNNPEKYRIGNEFYSEQEMQEIEKKRKLSG